MSTKLELDGVVEVLDGEDFVVDVKLLLLLLLLFFLLARLPFL